jgi:hypothetical protein
MKLNLSTLSAALALSTLTTRTLVALKKHWRQMRGAARVLTDAKNSVLVSQPVGNPKRLEVSFSVPKARQADVVDGIARQFWHWMEDYSDSSIGFESERQRNRRSRGSSRRDACR